MPVETDGTQRAWGTGKSEERFLPREALQALLVAPRDRGFRIVGPAACDEVRSALRSLAREGPAATAATAFRR